MKRNIIKNNVLGFFGANFTFGYERILSKHFSINFIAGYVNIIHEVPSRFEQSLSISGGGYPDIRDELKGFLVIPEMRYNLKKNIYKDKIYRGYYMSSFVRYKYLHHNFKDLIWGPDFSHTGISQELSTGLLFGYQAVSKDGFSFEWFMGPQIKNTVIHRNYFDSNLNENLFIKKFASPKESPYNNSYDVMQNGTVFGFRVGMTIGYAF